MKAKDEIQDVMRSLFWAKHVNKSTLCIFMEDLSRWCQWC